MQRSGPLVAQKLGGATETDIDEDDEYGDDDDDAEEEGEEEEEVEESEDEDYKVGSRKGAPSPFARPSRLAAFPGLPHGRSLLSLACGPAHDLPHSSSQGGLCLDYLVGLQLGLMFGNMLSQIAS